MLGLSFFLFLKNTTFILTALGLALCAGTLYCQEMGVSHALASLLAENGL